MSTSEETSHTRILVLDDGREFRLVLGRLLDRDGYDVTCVGTLLEARGAVQGEQFDILVFDLQLPDGRGTALLSELRETPEYADTPRSPSPPKAARASPSPVKRPASSATSPNPSVGRRFGRCFVNSPPRSRGGTRRET